MSEDSSGGGSSFAAGLTLVFVTLKLCHVIDWPWVWVLSPIWISLLLLICFIAIAAVIVFFTTK